MNSGQELPRVKLNSCVRIANKFLSKRQLPNSWIRYWLYEIFTKSITVHFEFLELSYFSYCIQTGFATQPPWNVMYKTRHALLGNSAHTYARTPLKWCSQNYTLCPCWSCHVNVSNSLGLFDDCFATTFCSKFPSFFFFFFFVNVGKNVQLRLYTARNICKFSRNFTGLLASGVWKCFPLLLVA